MHKKRMLVFVLLVGGCSPGDGFLPKETNDGETAECGNGLRESGELCDDGDTLSNGEGYCLADCSGIQVCGDGATQGTETCDGGHTLSNEEGYCLADCSGIQGCGNGVTEGIETCDDGNGDNSDSCPDGLGGTCQTAICGDGHVWGTDGGTELCDDGDTLSNGEGRCVGDCSGIQICGDGATQGTEACDDGDTLSNGEGRCIADCSAIQECGNGVVEGIEGCDDGDGDNADSCPDDAGGTCGVAVCGDGHVWSTDGGSETCDDGDAVSNGEGSCVADCSAIQTCGNEVLEGTEACDDGDTLSNGEGACVADCSAVQACGNSVVEGTEICDDGDTISNGNGHCTYDCSAIQGCGNGVVEGLEDCDDGNADNSDSCPDGPGGRCVVAVCGDGHVWSTDGGSETCDDGDTLSNGDGHCLADCSGIQRCGDGVIEGTETCDDGDTPSSGEGHCLADCSGIQRCGDGVIEGTETCDDGDGDNSDSCPDGLGGTCSVSACGDGHVWSTDGGSETCDDGDTASNGEGSCVADCSAVQTCGNGVLEGTEACDDGDTISNGNGHCTYDCSAIQGCGNGVVEGLEDCDDGNADNSDSCPDGPGGTCIVAVCGDGHVWSSDGGSETCDDGDTLSNGEDHCLADCSGIQRCGDGVIEGTETCDDGDGDNSDSCPDGLAGTCQAATCGDGHVWSTDGGAETCDDGDTISNGDESCVADCSSFQICGDGIVTGTELCDVTTVFDCCGFIFYLCGTDCMSFPFGSEYPCELCCGNDIINHDHDEVCDGTDLGGLTCRSLGFTGGVLACHASCFHYDTSNCFACGNHVVEWTEKCDGNDLNGASCASRGFEGGTLRCDTQCEYDVTGCW